MFENTDCFAVTTDLSKQQIIQQAAIAMMAQANQQPSAMFQIVKSATY